MKFSLLIALFCLIASQVYSQEKPTVILGSGGGITGMVTSYCVMPSGKVYRGKGLAEIKYTECAKIRRAKARKMINKVATAVSSTNFDHPGNMYYFLTLKENDGEKKITWGDADHQVPENIKGLFDEIHNAIADIKYKPITEKN